MTAYYKLHGLQELLPAQAMNPRLEGHAISILIHNDDDDGGGDDDNDDDDGQGVKRATIVDRRAL